MANILRTLFPLASADRPLLFLAPMAGYTNAPMRRICRAHGADLTYTEMTNDLGLLHESDKTWHLLGTLPDEGPVVAHLYGTEPDTMAKAAAKVEQTGRFVAIDLNAGCPVHKVTSNGAGAALIKDPDRVYAILRAMRQAVSLPLTIKTRLGPTPDRIAVFEVLRAAEEAGANAFALHGRFTSQGHGGDVRLDLLADVKRCARIPVIGNGGVCSPHDAWRMFAETGVDAVMIARAAIGNPWLFEDIRNALATGEEPPAHDRTQGRPPRDLADIRLALDCHMKAELEWTKQIRTRYGIPRDDTSVEEALATTFRCHLFRYLHGLKGSSYVRGRLHLLHTPEDIRAAVESCFERESAYRASAPWKTT